jgi:hypothetical protein
MPCDPGQDVGQSGLRIDLVHFGGDDQGVQRCGALWPTEDVSRWASRGVLYCEAAAACHTIPELAA